MESPMPEPESATPSEKQAGPSTRFVLAAGGGAVLLVVAAAVIGYLWPAIQLRHARKRFRHGTPEQRLEALKWICESRLRSGRVTAHTIAGMYGPLTGELAELAASGRADAIVKAGGAEKIEYTLGSGRRALRVTEHRILGEPYQVETVGRIYLDPISDLADGQVQRMVHGCGMDIGRVIADRKQMRRIISLLRTESYTEEYRTAWRPYRTRQEWFQGGGGRKAGWSAGSAALFLDLGSGQPVRIYGPLDARFTRTLKSGRHCYFINPPLGEMLKD